MPRRQSSPATTVSPPRPLVVVWLVVVVLLAHEAAFGPPAAAQPAPPEVSSLRLYVMDCGTLTPTAEAVERYHITTREAGETRMPVPCYLVIHPRGTLVWDAGVIPDRIVETSPGGARSNVNPLIAAQVTRTLTSQLAAIGYRPADIGFVAVSHAHIDHTANLNLFAGSLWLTRPAERTFMWTEGNTRVDPSFYSSLKEARAVTIEGDEHDVFGDGTVVIKAAPGHTPGHQLLVLRLARTGRVALGGDLYHYAAERTLRRPPPDNEFDVAQAVSSRRAIEDYLQRTGATLWIAHDFGAYQAQRKAPAYYD